jgi:hypothetical protein
MTEAAAEPTTPTAPDPEAPEPTDPPDPGEPTAATAEPEEQAAAATPEEISASKLGSWSKKLSHKQQRINAREGKLADRERALQEREQNAHKVLTLLETDPRELLDRLAERKGMTRKQVYEQWMQDELSSGTSEARVAKLEQELQRDREQRAQQAKEAEQRATQENQQQWVNDVQVYVHRTLPASEHAYLKRYPPERVAAKCTALILSELKRTGVEIPVVEMLSRMNRATKEEFELHSRQVEAVNPDPSQQNGAVEPAQPAPRKRAITNTIAATKATADDDEDDISDAALKRKSAEALRRSGTGWR